MRRPVLGGLAVVATALRGLRSRLLLTVGSVLLAAIAVAAAVVGPMYQSASASSFLVTQLRAQLPPQTGLTVDYEPKEPLTARQAFSRAVAPITPVLSRFQRRELSLTTETMTAEGLRSAQVKLFAEPGLCARLVVTGRCPRRPGEALLLAFDATHTHTRPGDSFTVSGVSRPLTMVGTYRLPTGARGFYDPIRFRSVLPQPSRSGPTPYVPGPFVVTPRTVTDLAPGTWFARADYRLQVPASTTVHDLRAAASEIPRLRQLLRNPTAGGTLALEKGNVLGPIVNQTQGRQSTAERTVTPAVVSLILVALVMLVRLLSAAMELRRSELALAALRGVDRRGLWVLGMLEPVLMLAVAAPVGVLAGYLAELGLSSAWLVPGLPVRFGWSSLWFAVGVVATSVIVAAAVVRSATDEPLSAQIAGVRRPARSRRWIVVGRLALVAAAVILVAGAVSSDTPAKPGVSDLLLPVVVAGAMGVLATLAAGLAARWWTSRTAKRRGLAGYVASRTIARRREGTWMILPMAVALAIAVFAGGIYTTAADWRASEAATMVGADTAFTTGLSLARAVALTHELDPGGRWLMAAGADSDISGPTAVVDAPRLARVGVWPGSWTPGLSVSTIASRLSPLRAPLRLTGRRLQITVDNEVSGGAGEILVGVELAAPFGQVRQIFVGPFAPGRSTLGASSPYCVKGCEVSGLSLSGPGALAQPMRGVFTISDAAVDGRAVPYFAGVGWRPRHSGPFADGPTPVAAAETSGGSLTVRVDSARKVVAELAPQDLPALSPAVMGRTPDLTVVARHDGKLQVATAVGGKTVVDPFATSESMPFFGPAGMLVDYSTYSSAVFDLLTTVHILARADTPSSVLAALAGEGITQRVTLVQVRHDLDQDAYALALNLYLVVTLIVLLLAFAGLAVTMAVEIPSRRRDAASLRVVGVPRRSILAAVVCDCAAILGTAAIAGILAGVLSQYLVVRTLKLGYVDDIFTPRVLPSLNLLAVVELLLASFAVMLCLAVVLGGLTIRGARTGTLREGG